MKPVIAGKLRHKVQLLARNAAQDTFGQSTGYTAYATPWAAIDATQGMEVYRAQQYTSEVSHVVTIRFSPNWTPKSKDRVQFGSRTFNIRVVLNVEERNRYWMLQCVELADGAAAGA